MKTKTKPARVLGADALRDALWETLRKVKNGTISPQQANAVSRSSKEILSTIRAEIHTTNLFGGAKPKGAKKFFAITAPDTAPPEKEAKSAR